MIARKIIQLTVTSTLPNVTANLYSMEPDVIHVKKVCMITLTVKVSLSFLA